MASMAKHEMTMNDALPYEQNVVIVRSIDFMRNHTTKKYSA